jgi:uncharacterized protein (DUF305 family)
MASKQIKGAKKPKVLTLAEREAIVVQQYAELKELEKRAEAIKKVARSWRSTMSTV